MKLSQPPKLPQLIAIDTYANLAKLFGKTYSHPLPKKIGTFKLEKAFDKVGTSRSFHLAIYKNAQGQKAMAKFWYGQFPDFAYYTFKNEAALYYLLNEAENRLSKTEKSNLHAQIPKLLHWEENADSLIMLTEFIDGQLAQTATTKQKLKAYWQITEYLSILGNHLTDEEKRFISTRTPLSFISLYPFLLIKALVTHPKAAISLLRGIPVFLAGIPTLIQQQTFSLIHRDLHFKNVILNKKKNAVIDLQLCVYSLPLYELVTTLRYRWGEDDLHKILLNQIQTKYKKVPGFQKLFKGLGVLSATHGLTGSHFPKQKIRYWIDFLNFSIA